MGRSLRIVPGGYAYHVLNRANAHVQIFAEDRDYSCFENILFQACERFDMRLCTYCIMPNHWHLVLWPKGDNEISQFTGWVTTTHARRWHTDHNTTGSGHLYQGRFKSFPVQDDSHFLILCRYVDRNPVNAGLVKTAQEWRWSAMWHRQNKNSDNKIPIAQWPVDMPDDWQTLVNEEINEKEMADLKKCIARNRPFGQVEWMVKTASSLGLDSTMKTRGRPSNTQKGA
jgi:putative transposase